MLERHRTLKLSYEPAWAQYQKTKARCRRTPRSSHSRTRQLERPLGCLVIDAELGESSVAPGLRCRCARRGARDFQARDASYDRCGDSSPCSSELVLWGDRRWTELSSDGPSRNRDTAARRCRCCPAVQRSRRVRPNCESSQRWPQGRCRRLRWCHRDFVRQTSRVPFESGSDDMPGTCRSTQSVRARRYRSRYRLK